jgi:kynurenine formamidase
MKEATVKLPSRIVDISSALDNETVLDHPFMRPRIEYRTNAQNAPMLLECFPGLRREDLPDGEGWAFEIVQLTTHNGTHMEAPMHFPSGREARFPRIAGRPRGERSRSPS